MSTHLAYMVMWRGVKGSRTNVALVINKNFIKRWLCSIANIINKNNDK